MNSDLFKLCKLSKLNESDKQQIIQNPTIKNNWGENLLHNYAKHNGCDFELMEKMIANGHDINNINKKGYSMIYSCFEFSKSKKINEKMIWLLKNNCPVIINGFDPIKIFFTRKFRNIEFIKLLCEKYNISRDLTIEKYKKLNPVIRCDNIDDALWYNSNFKVNYYAELESYGGNFTYDPLVLELIFSLFTKTDTINNFPNINKIYKMYFYWKYYNNLAVLYKYGFIDNSVKDEWNDLTMTTHEVLVYAMIKNGEVFMDHAVKDFLYMA
jgi:hypothetical protein